jgi:hypothetical protein
LELRYGDALFVDCVAPLPAPAGDLVGDALQSQVTQPISCGFVLKTMRARVCGWPDCFTQ